MAMMMTIRSPGNSRNEFLSAEPNNTCTFPTWKLYENPLYNYSPQPQTHANHQHQREQQQQHNHKQQLHRLHLPISSRKISASFWDLTFIKPPLTDSDLEMARSQIIELKAELDFERKCRKKMESMNKRLARELSEEKRGREELERVCQELTKEISADKAEINRLKREMEEERKMLRIAEVFREERIRMKLAEARLFLEEKLRELEEKTKSREDNMQEIITTPPSAASHCFSEEQVISSTEKSACKVDKKGIAHALSVQRRASPEPENPHIKRRIKGFVEFPKVVGAIGYCRNKRAANPRLECQKALPSMLQKTKEPQSIQ